MRQWVEHYLDHYFRENSIIKEALDDIEDLPILEELNFEPTEEELNKAIDAFTCGMLSNAVS